MKDPAKIGQLFEFDMANCDMFEVVTQLDMLVDKAKRNNVPFARIYFVMNMYTLNLREGKPAIEAFIQGMERLGLTQEECEAQEKEL